MDPSEFFVRVEREEQQRDEVVSRDVVGRSGADVGGTDEAGVGGGDVGPIGEAGIDAGVGEGPLHQDSVDFVILSQLLIRHLDKILVRSLKYIGLC